MERNAVELIAGRSLCDLRADQPQPSAAQMTFMRLISDKCSLTHSCEFFVQILNDVFGGHLSFTEQTIRIGKVFHVNRSNVNIRRDEQILIVPFFSGLSRMRTRITWQQRVLLFSLLLFFFFLSLSLLVINECYSSTTATSCLAPGARISEDSRALRPAFACGEQ